MFFFWWIVRFKDLRLHLHVRRRFKGSYMKISCHGWGISSVSKSAVLCWGGGGVNQAYSQLSTTHGHFTDCKLDFMWSMQMYAWWFNVDLSYLGRTISVLCWDVCVGSNSILKPLRTAINLKTAAKTESASKDAATLYIPYIINIVYAWHLAIGHYISICGAAIINFVCLCDYYILHVFSGAKRSLRWMQYCS